MQSFSVIYNGENGFETIVPLKECLEHRNEIKMSLPSRAVKCGFRSIALSSWASLCNCSASHVSWMSHITCHVLCDDDCGRDFDCSNRLCLLRDTADMSAVSHSRHVCCAAQETCMLCHIAVRCVTQQTCLLSHVDSWVRVDRQRRVNLGHLR